MGYRHETWYVLEDGTAADPNDVQHGADGVLRHRDGRAVAMRDGGVPVTTGSPPAADAGPVPGGPRAMEAEPKPKPRKAPYKTRKA